MRNCLYYQTLDSSMAEFSRLAETGQAADRWLVRAGIQTAGRGRDTNGWHSPRGGLWFTFDLHYPNPVPSFALFIGACLHRLLLELFPLAGLSIKWPNDIMLDGAKLAGILCQYREQEQRYIIGIGINTNLDKDEALLEYDAAILSDNMGFPVSNTFLSRLLVREVEARLAELGNASGYISYCNSQLYGLGRPAELDQGGQAWRGLISGVSTEGSLLLDVPGAGATAFAHGSLRLLPDDKL